jgi:hypothetical protein
LLIGKRLALRRALRNTTVKRCDGSTRTSERNGSASIAVRRSSLKVLVPNSAPVRQSVHERKRDDGRGNGRRRSIRKERTSGRTEFAKNAGRPISLSETLSAGVLSLVNGLVERKQNLTNRLREFVALVRPSNYRQGEVRCASAITVASMTGRTMPRESGGGHL